MYTVKAALKTFVFSRLSDFFILAVFLLFVYVTGSSDLSIIFLSTPFLTFHSIYIYTYSLNLLNILSVLLSAAAGIKAAQFITHVWLPDAMEAPTPASALIHSSTLVIMGIFLIIRFQVLFEFSYLGNHILVLFGSVTIATGAISSFYQNDIKKLIAFSTISQMGYLFCGCGFLAYKEVIFYLITHALNKAFLFMLAGYIVHFNQSNTDLRHISGTGLWNLTVQFILLIVSLNLTGLPLTSGFMAKELLVFQTFKVHFFFNIARVF